MIALDDYPGTTAVVGREGVVTDPWRRWFARLVQVVRASPTVIGQVARRVTASIAATWLRSSDEIPAGLYRLTAAVRWVSGTPTTTLTAMVDETGGGVATITHDLVAGATGTGVVSGSVIVRLLRGAQFGYAVTTSGGIVDVDLVVEAIPASTRLG